MKLSDLRKPAVFGRLLVGYVIAFAVFFLAFQFSTSFTCNEACPRYIAPWGDFSDRWRPFGAFADGFLWVELALLVAVTLSLVCLLSAISALVNTRGWVLFGLVPLVLVAGFAVLDLREGVPSEPAGWILQTSTSALAFVALGLAYCWFGWRPAWRAVGVDFSKVAIA